MSILRALKTNLNEWTLIIPCTFITIAFAQTEPKRFGGDFSSGKGRDKILFCRRCGRGPSIGSEWGVMIYPSVHGRPER